CLQMGEGNVEVTGKPVLQRAVERDLVQLLEQVASQPLPELEDPPRFGRHFRTGQLGGFAEPYDPRHVESTGSETALVAASIDERRQVHARIAAHVKGSHALGSVDLVCADGY